MIAKHKTTHSKASKINAASSSGTGFANIFTTENSFVYVLGIRAQIGLNKLSETPVRNIKIDTAAKLSAIETTRLGEIFEISKTISDITNNAANRCAIHKRIAAIKLKLYGEN